MKNLKGIFSALLVSFNEDGSINIPVPLRAYLGGITRLKAEKNDNTK